MTYLLNPKIGLTILLFIFLRFADADIFFKGIIFILCSLAIIYLSQKKYTKKFIFFLLLIISLFVILNEKKNIEEISQPLKINFYTENFYESLFGQEKFEWIKKYYIENASNCYEDLNNCFQESNINKFFISPDQLITNIKPSISRHVNQIKFTSIADGRFSFINPSSGNINYRKINKIDTPFYVQYSFLENINELCFKGLMIIKSNDGFTNEYNNIEKKCVKGKFNYIFGINLPNHNLEIESKSNNLDRFNDDIILFLLFILIISNLNWNNIKKDSKLFLPVLTSTIIIFFISKFDNWFEVFNLYNFYFFGFEGGDGEAYLDYTSSLFQSIVNVNLANFFRGGEDVFYYTPGLRYFLLFNQLISGDFYYFYFFLLFFLPRVILNFVRCFFSKRISYVITLSFLLLPIFHHLGFSYYQYIRHAYRLFPEPLGYMFFISALTIFLKSFEKNYLKMNLYFAIAVFLRPNLVISVFLIVLIKTFIRKINIFEFKYLFILFAILLIYLFPLIHNIYYGGSYVLFTEYGSKILSSENILSKDFIFYKERLLSINSLFLILLIFPNINVYFKVILISQYLTLFFFDFLGRYYWVYWLISLIIMIQYIQNYKIFKKINLTYLYK